MQGFLEARHVHSDPRHISGLIGNPELLSSYCMEAHHKIKSHVSTPAAETGRSLFVLLRRLASPVEQRPRRSYGFWPIV